MGWFRSPAIVRGFSTSQGAMLRIRFTRIPSAGLRPHLLETRREVLLGALKAVIGPYA